jgi:MFS family permease
MENTMISPFLAKILSFLFFLVFAVFSVAWLASGSIFMISEVMDHGPIIEFDKGSMYMLGASIALIGILVAGICQGFMGRTLTRKGEATFKWVFISGIAIMFIFPHIVHFYIESVIERDGYSTCDKMTYRWLMYGKYYYTDTPETCRKLVLEKGK